MVTTRNMMKNMNVTATVPRRSARLAGKVAPSYKSIIRTRAQKMKEHQMYLDTMFTNIHTFYVVHGREPTGVEDRVMIDFIASLRAAYEANNLGGQKGVDIVMQRLPWFKFVEPAPAYDYVQIAVFVGIAVPAAILAANTLAHACMVGECPKWAVQAYTTTATATQTVSGWFANVVDMLIPYV